MSALADVFNYVRSGWTCWTINPETGMVHVHGFDEEACEHGHSRPGSVPYALKDIAASAAGHSMGAGNMQPLFRLLQQEGDKPVLPNQYPTFVYTKGLTKPERFVRRIDQESGWGWALLVKGQDYSHLPPTWVHILVPKVVEGNKPTEAKLVIPALGSLIYSDGDWKAGFHAQTPNGWVIFSDPVSLIWVNPAGEPVSLANLPAIEDLPEVPPAPTDKIWTAFLKAHELDHRRIGYDACTAMFRSASEARDNAIELARFAKAKAEAAAEFETERQASLERERALTAAAEEARRAQEEAFTARQQAEATAKREQRNRRIITVLAILALLAMACFVLYASTPLGTIVNNVIYPPTATPTEIPAVEEEVLPTETPLPTATPSPTATEPPSPTPTAIPTDTPTAMPEPTDTPVVEPEVVGEEGVTSQQIVGCSSERVDGPIQVQNFGEISLFQCVGISGVYQNYWKAPWGSTYSAVIIPDDAEQNLATWNVENVGKLNVRVKDGKMVYSIVEAQ